LTQTEEESCGFFQTIVESFVNSDRKYSIAPADDGRSHIPSVAAGNDQCNRKQLHLMWRVDIS
jgi:hypothetical protein